MDAIFQQHEANYHPNTYRAPPENASRSSKLRTFKLVLQVVSIISSITAIGLSSTVATGEVTQSVLVWTIPPSAVAITWGLSEMFALYSHGWQFGIHIGAHVASNLLLWLGFTVALGLTGLTLKQDLTYNRTFYDWTDKSTFYYQPDFLAKLEATIFFLSGLDLLHFVLFVLACVEISKRNAAKCTQVTMASNNAYYDTTPIRPMNPQEPRHYYTATPPRVVTPHHVRSLQSSPQPSPQPIRQHVQVPVQQKAYVQHPTRQPMQQTSQRPIIPPPPPPPQPEPYFPSQPQSYFPSQRSYQAYQPQMYEPQHYNEPIQQQPQRTELPVHEDPKMEDIPVSPVSDGGYQLGYNEPWDMPIHPFSKEYNPN
ncbi:hypothetical protein GGR57DRAFT_479790 [Xylariaceae sp. FL1272]|nr:hypothetical protein GGR57DRAFT_479790 [Xylariaceae sp. FL1272]